MPLSEGVVVFIISLMSGLLVINISFGSYEDKIEEETSRLQTILRFAHEQSIIQSVEYGLRFHQTGYRFMTLEDDHWIDLSSDRHLTAREFENDMQLELVIEEVEVSINTANQETELIKDQAAAEKAILEIDPDTSENISSFDDQEQTIKPQIFLLSSGELSPDFSVRIRIPGEHISFEIQASINGEYKIIKSDD